MTCNVLVGRYTQLNSRYNSLEPCLPVLGLLLFQTCNVGLFTICYYYLLFVDFVSVCQEGGLNGFMHSFLAEVLAICRAHVAALGGNALVAFQLTECIIEDNVHKNQVRDYILTVQTRDYS